MEKPNNKEGFESAFQSAFDQAEVQPSPSLWGKIESGLEKQKSASYKKRLFMFQLVAAASFAMAMTVGGILITDYYNEKNQNEILGFYDDTNSDESNSNSAIIADTANSIVDDAGLQENKSDNIDDQNLMIKIDDDEQSISELHQTENKDRVASNRPSNQLNEKTALKNKKELASDNVKGKTSMSTLDDEAKKSYSSIPSEKPSTGDLKDKSANSTSVEVSTLNKKSEFLKINGLVQRDPEMVSWVVFTEPSQKSISPSKQGLWSGVNMSAGSFSSNGSDSRVNANSFSAEDAQGAVSDQGEVNVEEESRGTSFSLGMNIGMKLNNKFVLISGLNYLEQSTESTSNITANSNAISSLEDIDARSNIEFVENYNVINTYRSVALPVQIGYYLVEKKFDILLVGGVSNDLFLKKLSASEGKGTSEFNSSNEGYSLYSIGALVGAQFGYQIGDNYSIAIQSQYRRQLSSFTPQEVLSSGFELGLRLNYIFH